MIGRQKKDVPLANERIKFEKLQLIMQDGENRGIVSRREALAMAQEARLDLVVIAENGGEGLPVAKLIDLGKLQYERKKQQAEAKKKQHVVQIKEIKLRPKIAEHDFQTKMNQAIKFLAEGKHLKVTLFFRGREVAMKDEQGTSLFDRIFKTLTSADLGGKTVIQESETQAGSLWTRVFVVKK
ncbi:TPA: translation initiation factor IF-3 [Candidatus Dependentiae bacterium]|nr:MAG: Translation initiation factor IF-3 [candidate division TM6 bacterium GW2011_GWF2_43_87]HBL98703.1 translation initiation factor IF-3 [Candidatus Dependentiae bacterium]